MASSAKKSLSIEVQLLFAQFMQNSHISSHYSLTIVNQLTQFQTTIYPIIGNKADFSTLRPFLIQNEPETTKIKNFPALLKLIFTPLGSEAKLESIVSQRSVIPFSEEMSCKKQKKVNRNNKCLLAFPILYKGRVVVGEINIKFTFREIEQLSQINSSRVFASNISKNSIVKERKKVISSSSSSFFNPCVSRPIAVVATDEVETQYQEQKLISFKNKNSIYNHLQLQKEKLRQDQSEQPQQIVSNQENEIELAYSKIQKVEDKNLKSPANESSYEIQVPLSTNPVQSLNMERYEEIPEDYRHLFQKICQINKKYAPLQRIPSQQELSEELSLVHKSSNESFYSLNSQLSQTKSNPLAIAEQLLKQLNLYKFGQSLHAHSEHQSEQK